MAINTVSFTALYEQLTLIIKAVQNASAKYPAPGLLENAFLCPACSVARNWNK